MNYLTHIFQPNSEPTDRHEVRDPNDGRVWNYSSADKRYIQKDKAEFYGGDLWEDEDSSRPLPWVL